MLSTMQFRVYSELHRDNASLLAQRAIDVLHGQAFWRAYQSRLLGPAIVFALSHFLGSDRTAFLVFAGVFIFVAHAAAGSLSLGYLRRPFPAAIGLCVFSLSYALLFDYWSYPWDFIEVIVFLLFSHVVLERRSLLWMLPIFLVAVLNRESSLFIAVWFVIDPIVKKAMDREGRLQYGRVALGLALTLVAASFVVVARSRLASGSSTNRSAATELPTGDLVALWDNLSVLHFRGLLGLAIFMMCVLFVYRFFSRALEQRITTDVSFCALLALVLLQMLLFAVLSETRVFYTIQAMVFVAGLKWTRNAAEVAPVG